MYDIAIIGKGPAGIAAAISAASRNKSIIIFGKDSQKLLYAHAISNYAGIPDVSGKELMEKFNQHLQTVKAEHSQKQVTAVYSLGDHFAIQAQSDVIEAKAVILAAGVDYKMTIKKEADFLGRGVSYCATCDAPLYRGKNVCVVGYNEEAVKEAEFLSGICSKVSFVSMLKGDVKLNDSIEVIKGTPVTFEGDKKASKLILKDDTEIDADGFFIIKDTYPLTSLVPGVEVDGPHVVVNRNLETNIKGLYAAGDITGKPYQIAKAVGEGHVAALNAAEYISKL